MNPPIAAHRIENSTRLPRLAAGCVALGILLGAAPSPAEAQVPTGETKAIQAPFLDLPLRELGESFADPIYGFEFRAPIGFEMVDNIEQLRSENIVPEAERTSSSGVVTQVQLYLFREQAGRGDANILIRANEPAYNIQSPQELRAFFVNPDNAAGIPTKNVGKLYQVKMRGGDIAYFAQREVGYQGSGGRTVNGQFMAYIRTGARSLVISFTAPLDRFDELADTFKACLGSFILRDNPQHAATNKPRTREPKRFGGIGSVPVLANLGIAAVLVALLLKFLRGSSAGTGSGASTGKPANKARS